MVYNIKHCSGALTGSCWNRRAGWYDTSDTLCSNSYWNCKVDAHQNFARIYSQLLINYQRVVYCIASHSLAPPCLIWHEKNPVCLMHSILTFKLSPIKIITEVGVGWHQQSISKSVTWSITWPWNSTRIALRWN